VFNRAKIIYAFGLGDGKKNEFPSLRIFKNMEPPNWVNFMLNYNAIQFSKLKTIFDPNVPF
jgi:hypothetical protein